MALGGRWEERKDFATVYSSLATTMGHAMDTVFCNPTFHTAFFGLCSLHSFSIRKHQLEIIGVCRAVLPALLFRARRSWGAEIAEVCTNGFYRRLWLGSDRLCGSKIIMLMLKIVESCPPPPFFFCFVLFVCFIYIYKSFHILYPSFGLGVTAMGRGSHV